MTTGTATFDLPAGFLIEAQEYVASLREYLTGNGKDHSQTLAEMHRLLSVLSNSALMLNLEKLAELVAPSAQMLGDLVEAESELDSAGSQKLMATLDQIEVQINELMTPPTEEKQMSSGKSGGLLPPDLPPELVEIFTLEAQEHCQAIQQGLDRLRKEPDNTDNAYAKGGRRLRGFCADGSSGALDGRDNGTCAGQSEGALIGGARSAL